MIGCISTSHIATTSGVKESQLKDIPKGAKDVIIEKDVSADELYEAIYSALLLRGHRISKEDKGRHYITTEGKDIGESTLQRSTIAITEENGIAKATIRTEWKAGTEAAMGASMFAGVAVFADWTQAKWESGRPGIAFAESVSVANEVKDGRISFK